MGVMAAGVHHARIAGGKTLPRGQVILPLRLRHRQRVDVKPQRDHRPLAVAQDADDPGESAPHLLEKLRVGALGGGAAVFPLEGLLVRDPHPALFVADVPADQHLIAEIGQPPRDQRSGAHLTPAQLGVVVQVATAGDQFLPHPLSGGADLFSQFVHPKSLQEMK